MDIILQPLHITQDDITLEHEHVARKYSKRFLQLVKRMEKQGYYFESMNIKGIYKFNYTGATFPLEFSTQKEIYEYVKEIEV
jgi:hypothetical protein